MENPFELILDKLNTVENLLRTVIKNDNGPITIVTTPEVLNIDQAAEYLSFSKSTIYKLTSTRNIPHFKTGKKLLFKRSKLNEWVTQHRISTMAEIEKELQITSSEKANLSGRIIIYFHYPNSISSSVTKSLWQKNLGGAELPNNNFLRY